MSLSVAGPSALKLIALLIAHLSPRWCQPNPLCGFTVLIHGANSVTTASTYDANNLPLSIMDTQGMVTPDAFDFKQHHAALFALGA